MDMPDDYEDENLYEVGTGWGGAAVGVDVQGEGGCLQWELWG